MADGSVTTYFLGDSRGLERSLGRLQNSAGKTASSGSKMGAAFKKFGKMAAAGAAVAAAGVAAFAVSALKAAGEDEASQRKLAQTLRKTQGARNADVAGLEKWIDATSRASGVADDELRPALSKLLLAGKSQAGAMSDLGIAMDIAAATGKDLNTVTAAMQKAYRGNTASMGKLGLATKDAKGETLAYEEILKKAHETMGGAAKKAAGGFEGGMKRLNVAMSEAKESIGAKLLPVATKLVNTFLDKGVPALERLGDTISKNVVPVLKDIWTWVGTYILPVAKRFAAFVITKWIPALMKLGKDVLEGVKAGLKSIGEAIERNRPQLEKMWAGFKKVIDFIVTNVIPVLGTNLKFVLKIAGKAIGFVVDAIGFLIDAAPGVINGFIRPVVSGFMSFAQLIVTAADTAFGWIPGLGDKLHKAKEAVDRFKVQVDNSLAGLAASMRQNGEKIGAGMVKGIASGIRKNSGLAGDAARAVASRVAHQSGASRGVGLNAYASGTSSAKRGMAVVGEDGPELVYMRGGETVVPNGGRAGRRRPGGTGGDTYILNFNGPVAGEDAFVQLLRSSVRRRGGNVQTVLGSAR